MKKAITIITLFTCQFLFSKAQSKIDPASIRDKMQWFADAKLGIFIHAGIYSVNGIDESWSFHNNSRPVPDGKFVIKVDPDILQCFPELCIDTLEVQPVPDIRGLSQDFFHNGFEKHNFV